MVFSSMTKIDRRIIKSQKAIKNAFLALMAEKGFDAITIQEISDRADVNRRTFYLHYLDKYDLLDKLTDEHIEELRKLCTLAMDMNYVEAELLWFEYFDRHTLFFTTMLDSKGAHYFRKIFLAFVIEELTKDVGDKQEITLQFLGAAIVGIVEWWFTNGKPYPPQVMAEQVGNLLETNL